MLTKGDTQNNEFSYSRGHINGIKISFWSKKTTVKKHFFPRNFAKLGSFARMDGNLMQNLEKQKNR